MREAGASRVRSQRGAGVTAVLLGLAVCVMVLSAHGQAPLGRYHVDSERVTVSGISSGGYMAVQLGVAYSTVFTGVGVFAAGPFGCADADAGANVNARRALGPCMAGHYEFAQRTWCNLGLAVCPGADAPDAEASIRLAREKDALHHIDPLINVARQRIFLLSGTEDKKVVADVVDAAEHFYEAFVPSVQIERVRRKGVAHTFPTESFHGNDCAVSASPYISDCNYDGANAVLGHLYGHLKPHSTSPARPAIAFDQRPFFPGGASAGMADTGYIYVPASCAASESAACGLHIALHGCQQTTADIGRRFVENAGYNRWAETNQLIVLYPQIKSTDGVFSNNPMGCWDWWGYTGTGWDDRRGIQMRTIIAMIDRLKLSSP